MISGRSPTDAELDALGQAVPEIKRLYGLSVCFSVGLLSLEQAVRLKACGVDRINHNLNTSRRFHPRFPVPIATATASTRSTSCDKRAWRFAPAGSSAWAKTTPTWCISLCNSASSAEAVPVNFSEPIAGTPLESVRRLNPRYCLKTLALFRLAVPRCELRIAAGREMHLGPLQPLGLYAANSMFVGDYLTTKNQPPEEDYRMIEALGFTAVVDQ